ncbi:hypothetical protein NliqN6_0086 [Naganishia liquefaciens]|uniref:Uncharacterized protein n=1 Tax=Naganishia liquefaciens TaxID=104408 RepID=A0A8H3TMQ8_9TREE|nr:hypothetical protein NliqN6_0086 [Naganishia liquefaciens]
MKLGSKQIYIMRKAYPWLKAKLESKYPLQKGQIWSEAPAKRASKEEAAQKKATEEGKRKEAAKKKPNWMQATSKLARGWVDLSSKGPWLWPKGWRAGSWEGRAKVEPVCHQVAHPPEKHYEIGDVRENFSQHAFRSSAKRAKTNGGMSHHVDRAKSKDKEGSKLPGKWHPC